MECFVINIREFLYSPNFSYQYYSPFLVVDYVTWTLTCKILRDLLTSFCLNLTPLLPPSLLSLTDLLPGLGSHQTHLPQGLHICLSLFIGKLSLQTFLRHVSAHCSGLCSMSPARSSPISLANQHS